jgi:hypothetical protein
MGIPAMMAFDPAALAAFAGTLANLPTEEIRKAKKLYILNAIAEFQAQRRTGKAMIVTMGIMSIIPIFLIVFIPALIGYRSAIKAARQKILNAVEVWREDLGRDYEDLRSQAQA